MKTTYDVSVTLKSALHINGGTNADGTRVTVRSDDKAYIPATLFKGMVRENFEKLISILAEEERFSYLRQHHCIGKNEANATCSCPTCVMFGKAGFQRSRVYFDNLETKQELLYSLRANVAIDRYLSKARDGALVFSETVEALEKKKDSNKKQESVVFRGQVTAWLPDGYGEEILVCLKEAMKMITAVGLGKSRGLGFVEVNVCEAKSNI